MRRRPERSIFGPASKRFLRLGSVASRWTPPLTLLKRRVRRAVSYHAEVRTVKLGVLPLDNIRLLPPCLVCVVACGGIGLVGWLSGGAGWFGVRWPVGWSSGKAA